MKSNGVDLTSFRTDIRTESDINYDLYALPFLTNDFTVKNISQFLNYYNSFSEETQESIKNKLFSSEIMKPELTPFFIQIIDHLMCMYHFGSVDIRSTFIDFIKYFSENTETPLHSFRQEFINLLSHFIKYYPEVRDPEFFLYIDNFIAKFHDMNLMKLFHSLISVQPYPPPELVAKIINDVNSQVASLQPTDELVPLIFRFFNECIKNGFEVDYQPFLSIIPQLISPLPNKKVIQRFCEFVLIFPTPKPELLPLLLDIAKNCDKESIHEKLLLIFFKKMYRNIWRESVEASQIIADYSKQFLTTENNKLCSLAIDVFLSYQKVETIPFDLELANFLIDRIDWPTITYPVSKLIYYWITVNLYSDSFFQFVELLNSEYMNITEVLKDSNRSDPRVNLLYTQLERTLKLMVEFEDI